MTVCGSPPPPLSPAGDDQPYKSSTGPNPMSNPSDGQEMGGDTVPFNPGPRPRVMPKKAICFTMTLNSIEVAGPNPMLHLSADDVYYLTESDELEMDPPVDFSMDLLVIDSSNRRYMMNISYRENGDFLLNSEWHEFVLSNRLREKDILMFYRFFHNATGRFYYRLDFFKVPKSPPPTGDPADDEDCTLSRTLTASQVDPLDPMFLIDEQDAYDLTASDAFRGPDSASCCKIFFVYNDDMVYAFEISPFFANKEFVGYRICGEWADFVENNKLKVGDRIFFLLVPDNESDKYVYTLKFLRKNPLSSDDVYTFDEVKPGPVSSMPANSICLSRPLTAFEVVHAGGKPRLFLDSFTAYFFMGPHVYGTLKENLVVFDDTNRQYDMLLSQLGTKLGDMEYVVDAGWQRFVKTHNLKAGDHIKIYRMGTNYLARYERKIKVPIGRAVSVAGPSGGGTGPCDSGAEPARSNGTSLGKGKGIAY